MTHALRVALRAALRVALRAALRATPSENRTGAVPDLEPGETTVLRLEILPTACKCLMGATRKGKGYQIIGHKVSKGFLGNFSTKAPLESSEVQVLRCYGGLTISMLQESSAPFGYPVQLS